MAKKQEPPMALADSIRSPLGKELLRRCVLADRPLHLDEVAASMKQPRFRVRFHAEELAKLGALKESEALWPWRQAGRRYEATPILMNSQWALVGLGLMPGDHWLTDEEIAAVNEHIAERRKDTEFMERLHRRVEEDLPVLEALDDGREPLRLWRRAWARLRSRSLHRRHHPRGRHQ